MKHYAGSTSNISFDLNSKEKTVIPMTELVLMAWEPVYERDGEAGDFIKKEQVTTIRLKLDGNNILSLLATLVASKEQMDAVNIKIEKADAEQQPE